MKHLLARLTAISTFIAVTPAAFSQLATDEEAIKKVCKTETDAYFRRDFDAWKSTWVDDPKVTRVLVANNFIASITGTQQSDSITRVLLADNTEPMPTKFSNDNYIIRSNGNLAWIEYDQLTTVPPNPKPQRSREYRLLTKENGNWKLTNQVTLLTESFSANDASAIENDLNTTGYKLLAAKRVNEAIEVFKLNVKLHPKAWNPYDSLGEAYAIAGQKELAIKNYEKSLELNPKNENGKKALQQLRQK